MNSIARRCRRFTLPALPAAGIAVACLAVASAPARAADDAPAAGSPAAAESPAGALAILSRSDALRNPSSAFSVTMTLAEYRGGKEVAASVIDVFVRIDGATGQYNNLVRYVSPKRESGKLVLRNGLDLWFYDPASKASIRLSPQARLIGQASTGDVMSISLAKAYGAVITGHDVVEDDEKERRPCARLRLTGQRPDLPYALVDYWVDEASSRPLKAQFYTTEGRLLKTAFFRRYRPVLGHDHPTETVIVDGLDPAWITVIRETDLRARNIPQTWFQRAFLPDLTWDD